jgi:hypothetical protein
MVVPSVLLIGYGLDDRGVVVRFPAGAKIFLFSTAFTPVLGPNQLSVQWIPGDLSPRFKAAGA